MPKRKLYNPEDSEPYPLSRSRIENFINCPRCFHLEERQGIKAPSGPQFLLNSGIDTLYKNEFDSYRKKKIPHPLMEKNNINAIPFSHKDLDLWRNNFKGIRWFDEKHNFTLFGAVDDLWINEKEEIHIVDYKSTAKKDFSPNFTSGYQVAYKRQLEIYHWLFKKNNFKMSNIRYIVYANGITTINEFNGLFEFEQYVFPIHLDDSWVDNVIQKMYECLQSDKLPPSGGGWNGQGCEQCAYKKSLAKLMRAQIEKENQVKSE